MPKVHEYLRTYIFREGHELEVLDVRDVKVSESGGHRLTCKGGEKVYVTTGWLGIEIDSDRGWEM